LLLLAPLVVAGCSGGLDFANYQPQLRILSPVSDDRVPFCPALLTELQVASIDGSFPAPPETTTTTLAESVDGDDSEDYVYAVFGVFEPTGLVSPTLQQLAQQGMSFDVGPTGAVYDDAGPQPAEWVPDSRTAHERVPMTRELVGGGKKSDTRVELTYEYVPSCETLTIDLEPADGVREAMNGSCTCEPTTITFSIGS
ncbi:MAG TPA: hypothetical protein VGF99_04440, partial [Myxococcota bacterium]